MTSDPNLFDRAAQLQIKLSEWRRKFHENPELAFEEKRTAAAVASLLDSFGCQVKTGLARTGVVGDLGKGKPVVVLRADMDALPLQETNQVPYRSKQPGIMHACGHDAHTAMLLGAAKLLAETPFQGRVRFLFQPAEEAADEEGQSGAPRMIKDGAVQDMDWALALHVDPGLETGKIALSGKNAAAGDDSFNIRLVGRGGHGAAPYKTVDPIYISGLVIQAIHGICSRKLNPFDPAVISIGSIQAGQADNVIPGEVLLSGTIRYHDQEVRQAIRKELEDCLRIAQSLGGEYQINWTDGYPPMHNHPEAIKLVEEVAREFLGEDCLTIPLPSMGAEDFGFYLQQAKGAMFRLGCRIEDDPRQLHDSKFDLDENCLPIGSALLAGSALRLLTTAPIN